MLQITIHWCWHSHDFRIHLWCFQGALLATCLLLLALRTGLDIERHHRIREYRWFCIAKAWIWIWSFKNQRDTGLTPSSGLRGRRISKRYNECDFWLYLGSSLLVRLDDLVTFFVLSAFPMLLGRGRRGCWAPWSLEFLQRNTLEVESLAAPLWNGMLRVDVSEH